MSLTADFDARDTDNIFTTFGNPPSGTPSDGSAVEEWLAESGDLGGSYAGTSSESPVWRQSSPGLLLPCLDFDGSNDRFILHNDAGGTPKTLTDFIANNAFCLMAAIRVEAVVNNDAADPSNNDAIFCDSKFKWGLSLRNDSGQVKLQGWNNDGSFDFAEINVSIATNYVVMYRHDSGNLYISVNGGSETSVASGNTSDLTGAVYIGENLNFGANYNGRLGRFRVWNTANADGNQASELAAMIAAWVSAAALIPRRLLQKNQAVNRASTY